MPKILSDVIVINKKGQLVLPVKIRKQLKISAGTRFKIKVKTDGVELLIEPDPLSVLRGMFEGLGMSAQEMKNSIRAEEAKYEKKF